MCSEYSTMEQQNKSTTLLDGLLSGIAFTLQVRTTAMLVLLMLKNKQYKISCEMYEVWLQSLRNIVQNSSEDIN
jgi:hypothetical protein